jgi:hypothetical protein
MPESLAIVDNEITNNLSDTAIVCVCITIAFQRDVRPFEYTAEPGVLSDFGGALSFAKQFLRVF